MQDTVASGVLFTPEATIAVMSRDSTVRATDSAGSAPFNCSRTNIALFAYRIRVTRKHAPGHDQNDVNLET
jgi:hypothetical protein